MLRKDERLMSITREISSRDLKGAASVIDILNRLGRRGYITRESENLGKTTDLMLLSGFCIASTFYTA